MAPAAYARPVVFSFILLALPVGHGLTAQQIFGRALDADEATPVPTALVVLTDSAGDEVTASVADSLGRFTVTAPEGGVYHLVAERIGYQRTETPLLALPDTGSYSVNVLLIREPVALDEIRVDVGAVRSRLERRRMAYAEGRSAAFDGEDLDNVVAYNLVDHLASRSGAPTAPCFEEGGGARPCFEYRNALIPICVYLDDAPLAGGVQAVSAYADYIERVEVYPRTGWIRMYSRPFMMRVKEGEETIPPFAGTGEKCPM